MTAKQRLDTVMVDRGLVESREKAKRLIIAGKVSVAGMQSPKPGALVAVDTAVVVAQPDPFVSRGGFKLSAALEVFGIIVSGRVCVDVGASTGGFTDCLLQQGAAKVYCIDVGDSQLHEKLKRDERVVVMDKTNARFLDVTTFSPLPDLLVMDVSFISVLKILPQAAGWLSGGKEAVVLIKPQFEADKAAVSRGKGVIREPAARTAIVTDVLTRLEGLGWQVHGLALSPIRGGSGNVEFLAHLGAFPQKTDYLSWNSRIDVDALQQTTP